MKPLYPALLIIITITLFVTCDLPHEPGPMPGDLIPTEFEAGLNILGVLRADEQTGTSFISINRALTTEEIYSDSIEDWPPEVDFVKLTLASSGTEYFFLKPEDSFGWGKYQDTTLDVQPGQTFELEISAPDYPTLTGETAIPQKPALVLNTLSVASGRVSFQLQHHASAFEYKLYLIFSEITLEKVIKPRNEDILDIDWVFNAANGVPQALVVGALDENLTSYGNSGITFIPNTYHADGSTVTDGYGCFGSVAIATFPL